MSNFLMEGMNALNAAQPEYITAKSFYDGTTNETFTSKALQKALGSKSADFSFNYSRIVISSRLDRMEISSVATENGVADDLLADIWNRNQLDQEFQDAFEASLVYGDAYLIVGEGDEGIDIFYNDPMSTRVIYEVENPRKKKFAIKRWMDGEKLRVNIYTPSTIEKYISKGKPTPQMQDGDFEAYMDEDTESWPLVNETGQIPVFHLRTGRQYGKPEHRQSYGPQRSITKLLSTQISSIDFMTAPQRYFLQDPAANDGVDLAADFGGITDDDDNDAVSNLKSGPGGVWNLKGIKQVGQFDAPSPDTFISPFKTFVEAMSTLTATPMHAFNVGALPSGESLRAAEAPLNKRVASLELLFGGVIADLHEYALELSGVDAKVLVGWAPAATYDDADVWATVKLKTDAGVPARTALMEAGYTAEQVNEWYPEDTTIRTAADLSILGDAITKVASAVTLGIISREEARALMPQDILIEGELVDINSLPEVLNPTVTGPSKEEAMQTLIAAGVDPQEAAERVGA